MFSNIQDDANKKILVIDDDEGDCCLVEDILVEEGIEVVKAVGGEQGIRILAEETFPIIITDLKMPDIDGFGVLDFIHKRRIESLVVVITGYARIDTVIEALRSGAHDYIIKPFGTDLLKLTIKRAFDFIALRDGRDRLKYFNVLTQIATTAAHEVFQPLTVLMGQANAIQKQSTDEEIQHLAHEVLQEARKIRDVIKKMENMRDYAVKTLPGGHTIIDIDKGSSSEQPK
ncbi:MAG: response regulator [Thermodesulfobacteriota bacterium]|nr:response regulator [Thermodesulfobacteriota bacterium]